MIKKYTQEDVAKIAAEILKKNKNKKRQKASVFSFEGPLGSGKTTMVQQIGQILGIKEYINSPTFNILKNYKIPKNQSEFEYTNLIHIDAYRLKTQRDLELIGFYNFYNNKDNLIIIEWGNLMEGFLPESVCVEFFHEDEKSRKIKF